eukprot:scaffold157688_cov31-Attheya_sp.AAC.1
MEDTKDPYLALISYPLFGIAAVEGEQAKKLIDTVDFVRAVRSLPGGAKVAVAHDDEMEACVSPNSPPVSVTLPPRLPPNRLRHSTQGEGVVEQYERFIFVMELFFLRYVNGGKRNDRPAFSLTLYRIDGH